MTTRLDIAINNLVGQCEAIPAALGSTGTQTRYLSKNPHTFSIPYPNAITTGGPEHAERHLVEIEQFLSERPPDAHTAVIDSYSNLDLEPLGFQRRFADPWTLRVPSQVDPPVADIPCLETVETPEQLAEFDRAAAVGFGEEDTAHAYSNPLLRDDRYRFVFIRENNEIVAGIQTFTDSECVGIYTLFTLPDYRRKGFARALVNRALSSSPELAATTNPSDMSVSLFKKSGFNEIGKRRVWVHRPD